MGKPLLLTKQHNNESLLLNEKKEREREKYRVINLKWFNLHKFFALFGIRAFLFKFKKVLSRNKSYWYILLETLIYRKGLFSSWVFSWFKNWRRNYYAILKRSSATINKKRKTDFFYYELLCFLFFSYLLKIFVFNKLLNKLFGTIYTKVAAFNSQWFRRL